MNVYDFDGTIYRGDSTKHFYFFCLRKRWRVLCYAPRQAMGFVLYALGCIDKTGCKQRFFSFLKTIDDVDSLLVAFWEKHLPRVQRWYQQQQQAGDVIISASPEFLLAPACERLGIGHLLASRVDKHTGEFTGLNCHGEEKVMRFQQAFGQAAIEQFYSDSLSDAPLARLAQHSFFVKGERITPWP